MMERKRLSAQRRYRERVKDKVIEYLSTHPCVDCGEDDIVVLEFDHVRGEKKRTIASMLVQGLSFKRVLEEIEKCDVRCANCHRRKTAKGFNWLRATPKQQMILFVQYPSGKGNGLQNH